MFEYFLPGIILFLLIFITTIRPLFCKREMGRIQLFSPISIIGLTLFYYVMYPLLRGKTVVYGVDASESIPYLLWGTILFLLFVIIGFNIKVGRNWFKRWNKSLDGLNLERVAFFLFGIALVGYLMFNGFSLSVINVQETMGEMHDYSEGQSEAYITNLISFFPLAICLLIAAKSKKRYVLLLLALAVCIYLIAAFRNRLVIMLLCFGIFYHIYPNLRKINWKIWIPIGIIFYFSLGVLEIVRSYGRGIDAERLESLESGQFLTESSESEGVYIFSALAMKKFSDTNEYVFLEPALTAFFMPIPRAVFPWKPNNKYLQQASEKVNIDSQVGGAVLNYAEGFISFGWFGVMLYGFVMGVFSRIFWSNYLRHRKSIGATLLTASFSAITYLIISRGYLAGAFMNYMFYIVIPFWLIMFIKRFSFFKVK